MTTLSLALVLATMPAPTVQQTKTQEPPLVPNFQTVKEEAQIGPITLEKVGEGEIAKRAPKDGEEIAILKTAYGRIAVMFFPDKAPNMVKRFKEAAKKGIYNGTTFHRVIPGFMIQGGDPNSADDDRSNDGTGGWGPMLKAEFNDVAHVPGILSTARTSDPNSAQSQFFIMHGVSPHLDGKYTVFGKVIEGMKVVDIIVNLPKDRADNPNPDNVARVYKVEVAKWPIK